MLTVLKVVVQWVFLLLSGIVLDLLGLFVVAIAIPFRVNGVSGSDGRAIVNLPRWAWLWGNDYDGLQGDNCGWWAANTPFGWPVDSFLAMWWWAAIRNPSNNMRFVSLWNAPVTGSAITYKANTTSVTMTGRADGSSSLSRTVVGTGTASTWCTSGAPREPSSSAWASRSSRATLGRSMFLRAA
jgi:hypothetical protein